MDTRDPHAFSGEHEDEPILDWPTVNRADFLKLAGVAATGAVLLGAGCGSGAGGAASPTPTASRSTPAGSPSSSPSTAVPVPSATPPNPAYLAVVKGPDPAAITRAAVEAVGGMSRFVKKGADVIIKPNICLGYRRPEYAATTNPIVVATLVRLCLKAGAKSVRVMDNPFGSSPEQSYAMSGIGAAVKAAGGRMEVMSPFKFVNTAIPRGRSLTSYPIYHDILHCDTLINVSIAKTHDLTGLTLGGKNLMGAIVNRQNLHPDIGQRIADLGTVVRPTLNVVDAFRILTAGGPTGGELAWVRPTHTVIASHDIVAADAYAATLFGRKGSEISYVRAMANMHLGRLDLRRLDITKLKV
jgi:uncharacterized protein (DUF362 family)